MSLQILSLALPAGKITVVECASQKELATTNAAFQQLTDRSLGTSPSPLQPLLLVDGRALGDWGDEVLREAVVYFSGQEPKLPFQAGIVPHVIISLIG